MNSIFLTPTLAATVSLAGNLFMAVTSLAGECEQLEPDPTFLHEILPSDTQEVRIALVIGNGDYRGIAALDNPENDARAVAGTLQNTGFRVFLGTNLDARAFAACKDRFISHLEGDSTALMFYAGHGIQVDGKNYLLSVDVNFSVPDEALLGTIPVSGLLAEMGRAPRRLIFLDACRDNPLEGTEVRIANTRQVGMVERGLAVMQIPDATAGRQENIYIAYATSPNKSALDGAGNHSPFAEAFLKHAATPGLHLQRMMSRVNEEVGRITNWSQTPWSDSSLTSDFYFNGRLDQEQVITASRELIQQSTLLLRDGERRAAIAAALKVLPRTASAQAAAAPDIANEYGNALAALYRAYAASYQRLSGHTAPLNRGIFSADGQYVITASDDNTAKIWNARTGAHLNTLRGHTSGIAGLAVSPDGTRVATGSRDKTVRIWNPHSGVAVHVLQHDTSVDVVDFSPDGTQLLTATNIAVRKWSVSTGEELFKIEEGVRGARFSPDGTRFLTIGDGPVTVRDATDGARQIAIESEYPGTITDAYFSGDGDKVLTGSMDGVARVWDAGSGTLIRELGDPATEPDGMSARFSSDARQVITATPDRTVRVWNVESGALLLAMEHDADVQVAAFANEGGFILSSTRGDEIARNRVYIRDAYNGEVQSTLDPNTFNLWTSRLAPDDASILTIAGSERSAMVWRLTGLADYESPVRVFGGQASTELGPYSYDWQIAFSHDGEFFASRLADEIKVWQSETGEVMWTFGDDSPHVALLGLSGDGERVLTAAASVQLWNVEANTELAVLASLDQIDPYRYSTAEFSPDGSKIGMAYDSHGRVGIWDGRAGSLRNVLVGHTDVVRDIVFSPDSTQILTASLDGTARLWDAADGQPIRAWNADGGGLSAAYSQDGSRALIATGSGSVGIWNTASGASIHQAVSRELAVNAVAISPDGRYYATVSEDKRIFRYDTLASGDGVELEIPGAESSFIQGTVSFSPDGQRTMTVYGFSVDFFDTASGRWIDRLIGADPSDSGVATEVRAAAFGPSGEEVVVASLDAVRVWRLRPYGQQLVERSILELDPALRKIVEAERLRYRPIPPVEQAVARK